MRDNHRRRRVVIDKVEPEVDGGRYPAKRTTRERVRVSAEVFCDGHDAVAARLRFRHDSDDDWQDVPMLQIAGDLFEASFVVERLGTWRFTIEAWIDRYESWRRDILKKAHAGQDVQVDRQVGALLVEEAARAARGEAARTLAQRAAQLRKSEAEEALERLLDLDLTELMRRYAPHRVSALGRDLRVLVERERARFSAWYELFPRSAAREPHKHGTFDDVIARLDYVASMGFDVLYLPPIHPIGRSFRKGKNNAPAAAADDVGSPWAIGAPEGGHMSVHPLLGTLSDFDRLVKAAAERGIEVALDIALQCSPDHPWVVQHPEWFRKRPDGSIQYAENPPKKYQDVYPFDFETDDVEGLWEALAEVFRFWIRHGVRIFRVDNPHTKPFAFWEWVIGELRRQHPEVILLAEAFARPAVMYRLAKLGFSLSYNYFPWKNARWEIESYYAEITKPPVSEFFRPSSWPNTPDILNAYLQYGGRPAFIARLVLAATLSASYGIYGPPFELCVAEAREPGSEEYLDSEKYQLRHWPIDAPHSLAPLIARINAARKSERALQSDRGLLFHKSSAEPIVCYSKMSEDGQSVVLVVVNVDPHHIHGAWLDLDLDALGIDPDQTFQVHDLLGEARYLWRGPRSYVELNPHELPARVFRVRRHVRSEHDFEYFL